MSVYLPLQRVNDGLVIRSLHMLDGGEAKVSLSVLWFVGGVLAGDDLVDALSEAAVRGQATGRLTQILHAVVRARYCEGFGVFH